MKVYKSISWVVNNHYKEVDMSEKIGKYINEYQNKGWEVEIQYSSCANNNNIIYSALILAYTEE